GCDPAMFAEQCADYLERARAQRATQEPDEPVEIEEEPQPLQAPEPVVVAQAMKPAEVLHEPAPAPALMPTTPPEFVEFDLTRLIEESAETLPPAEPALAAATERHQVDEAPVASPSSDIWIPPRLGVERLWPKMETPDTQAAVASTPKVPKASK